MKIVKFLQKSFKKEGQQTPVNSGSNADALCKNEENPKCDVQKVLCFSNQNGPPPEIRSKRRKSREADYLVNNGTERSF